LTQHPRDEDPKLQKVHVCFEVEPHRTWYYGIFLNSHTLLILLQNDLAFIDEPKTVYEGCYKTKDIFIFAWFSILGIRHYCWLCNLIRRFPPNNKLDYLGCTIRRILNFLKL
jgi:hypothetical protein